MVGIFPDEPPNAVRLKAELIDEAKAFDDSQEARAKEFELQYERVMGRKLHQRDPVTWAWLRKQLAPWRWSCSFPGKMMPWMMFGDLPCKTDAPHVALSKTERWAGYIPIERRMVLADARFVEILSAGDKTPRRNMVEVK